MFCMLGVACDMYGRDVKSLQVRISDGKRTLGISDGKRTLGIHGRVTLMWIVRKCGVMM